MTGRCAPGSGWTMKRTRGREAGPNGSMSSACSAEVRAPVSTFALSAGRPSRGRPTHSSQPRRNGARVVHVLSLAFRRSLPRRARIANEDHMAQGFEFNLKATRRQGPHGAHLHPARRDPHARLHARGHRRDGQGDAARKRARRPGADILLGNTYHLMLRPTAERIERLGGLHRFMNWERPILTDSGGFQVMSLADLRKLTEGGVTFRSHIDGSRHELTPERSMEIQRLLGSDIVMCFDECPALPADEARVAESMRLSMRWAERSRDGFRRPAGPRALRHPAGRRRRRTCARKAPRRCRASASTATRSAGSRWARGRRRCSACSTTRRACCPRTSRAT